MTDQVTINKGFYLLLRASQKALVARLGGNVEITRDELEDAENLIGTSKYISEDRWLFTVEEGEPPDTPTRAGEQ